MIRKYTVKRDKQDNLTITEEELTSYYSWKNDKFYTKWEFVMSINTPRIGDLCPQAERKNPHIMPKRGKSYTFYACVYRFPEPRLMGKFSDYGSMGW